MDSGNADTPPRRERKKWERETSISLYVNEAELSKWTSRKASEVISPSIPSISSPKPSFSPSSTSTSTSTFSSFSSPSPSTTSTSSSSSPVSSPSLQRSRSKSQLVKSTSSPKPTRARPPSPSPSSSSSSSSSSPSLSRSAASPSSSSVTSPSLKQPPRERFKSPLRATPPQRNIDNTNSNNNKIEKSSPAPKSTIITSSTANTNVKNNPPSSISSVSSQSSTTSSSPSSPPQTTNTSPPVPRVGDPADKSRIVNFMCGVLKIFAHLASLPDGSEKQKDVKLAALEKRCKERLPPGLCMSVLDVLNDFRFLNALYDLPDQLEDIKSTTNEFEKKITQFISIVSAKFGGMDLMKEQASILSSNSSKKIQIGALRSALKSGNSVIFGEAIHKCKEVGLDVDTLDVAQNIYRFLNPDSGIAIQEIPKHKTLLQRAITTHLLEESFVNTQLQRLTQIEESLQIVESSALSSANDGNLAPLRDSLDKASSAGLSGKDLSAYRAAYQDLHSRLHAVREIVMATKEKHQTKLQRALDQARTLKNTNLSLDNNETTIELGQIRNTSADASEFIRKMKEGETGVHKMMKEAVQSGTSVLSHLESVAAVRSLLETSVSTEDKIGLEEVVNRGGQLGMNREVETAKSAIKAMDRVRIKCHLHTDIRILSIPRETQFGELKNKIEQTYAATTPFIMKYRDDVGDLITLSSQEDFSNALLCVSSSSVSSVETPTTSRRGTPKLDVFLALPASTSVRSSLEVKERARERAPKVHPNTQLAASVQQLYELLSADRGRVSSPSSSLSNNSSSFSSSPPLSLSNNSSPPLPRTRPVTSSATPISSVENPPTYSPHHYDHLIDPEKERERNNNNNILTPMPPKTSKSTTRSHKRSKSREPKDKLFVAGKSFNP